MAALAGPPGIIFFAIGAWPVVGFLGLDVRCVWWALAAGRCATRKRSEQVTLWPDQLELRQSTRGRRKLRRFNPMFVKLVIDRGLSTSAPLALHLRTGDRDIGSAPSSTRTTKSSFAKAFGTALRAGAGLVSLSVKTGSSNSAAPT